MLLGYQIMSLTPRPFSCCCCNHTQATPAGSYLLSTLCDEPLYEDYYEIPCPMVACTNCSHVTIHPLPSEVIDGIKRYFTDGHHWESHGMNTAFSEQSLDENLTHNPGLWERFHRAKRQLAFILSQVDVPDNAKILDVGSGFAPFLYHCRHHGFENLYALEPFAEICRFLNGQGIITYPMLVETFITRDDLPQFDLVVLSQVLEDLIEPAEVLCGLRRLLSENGVLFIEVPYGQHHNPYSRSLHPHFFNETSLARLLHTCGYQPMVLRTDRLNGVDALVQKAIHFVYVRTFFQQRSTVQEILESPLLKYLHPYCWRPLKWLLRLKMNIMIPSENLTAIATR